MAARERGLKVVLFCGGQGLRMRDFSDQIPKPMVPIGPRPVMWHLMKYFAHYGHKDFILCLGHRGEAIKEYFLNYKEWLSNDFTLDGGGGSPELLATDIDDWRITFVDTGVQSNIGARLRAVREHLGDDEVFLANYADGLTDLQLPILIDHFYATKAVAAFLCTVPSQTFHIVQIADDDRVLELQEASRAGIWVNAGFFVLSQEIFDVLGPGEDLVVEPFRRLAAEERLYALRYGGFWTGVDTFKDRQRLEEMHKRGDAPWQVWARPSSSGSTRSSLVR